MPDLMCPYCESSELTAAYDSGVYSYFCKSCRSVWTTNQKLSSDDFKEKFGNTLGSLIHGSVKQMAVDKIKGSFTMTKAERIVLFSSLVVLFGVRDRRNRSKIKELKKAVKLLNMENDFLIIFVKGLVDPKANKEEILKTLGTNFQFLNLVKDV